MYVGDIIHCIVWHHVDFCCVIVRPSGIWRLLIRLRTSFKGVNFTCLALIKSLLNFKQKFTLKVSTTAVILNKMHVCVWFVRT